MNDFIGNNYYAARSLDFHHPLLRTPKDILIREGMSAKDTYQTMKHEFDELTGMAKADSPELRKKYREIRKMEGIHGYFPTHKRALKSEKSVKMPPISVNITHKKHINHHLNQNHNTIMEIRN
jgi:hypothetical protein